MSVRFRILAADPLAKEGVALLRDDPDFELTEKFGQSEDELAACIGEYDAVIVRSGVRISAGVLNSPGRLRMIARAGVGVDNIDLAAATAAGVIVLNTPDANTLSTAEHTMAIMLGLARRIPQAHAHVAGGGWERSRFKGVQLAGKTLGVIGFGRIGRAVAARALALDMSVIAHDPLVRDRAALGGRVRLCETLETLLGEADVITLHAAVTPQTRHLIDAAALKRMKPSAMLINCARGELVDEAALAAAIREGRLAGAGVDVYSSEPPRDNPLIGLEHVLHTPHLGASTVEAQRAVSVDAVRGVIAFCRDGVVRNAVNIVDLPHDLSPRDQVWVDVADRVGRMLAPLCAHGVSCVRLIVHGESLGRLSMWLGRHVMVRLLEQHLSGPMGVVNVLEQAAERAIAFEATTAPGEGESLTVEIETPEGRHTIEAALGERGRPRIRLFDGHALDMSLEGHMVVVANQDTPGAIGLVATAFGDAGVNIADLAVSRRGSEAMMVLKVDKHAPPNVLDDLRSRSPTIRDVWTAELPPIPSAEANAP
ncbi:MAG: phosphoglycerate dehydrogenase [Planctomycetes bacterium]|nr:phosphoglycerate dehydrogenase [Planctomycetota bacterium]